MTQEQPNTNLYIPPSAISLSNNDSKQQIRLGIQGYPGTGKNWSILGTPDKSQIGFPNCIVGNCDRGLSAFQGRDDIYEIKFWDNILFGKPEEKKDKITEWMRDQGTKLKTNQTFVMDSLSKLDQIYHSWFAANETAIAVGKGGKYNDFAEYQVKNKWFAEIHNIMGTFRCDIILLCHESERPDKPTTIGTPGMYTGKIRPILSGQFGDTIIKEYTDWFRQHCGKKTLEPAEITLANFRMTKAEFLAMQSTFVGDTLYYWQTKGDDLFNAKASSLINPPTYIPATYESFRRYQRNK